MMLPKIVYITAYQSYVRKVVTIIFQHRHEFQESCAICLVFYNNLVAAIDLKTRPFESRDNDLITRLLNFPYIY